MIASQVNVIQTIFIKIICFYDAEFYRSHYESAVNIYFKYKNLFKYIFIKKFN